MWIFLLLAATTAVAAGCSSKAVAQTSGPSHVAQLGPIVALGDSLTSGYGLSRDEAFPAVLERMLRIAVLLCGMEALPLYGWEYTVEFHRLFPALAEKHGVPLVPFLLDGVAANPEMLQPDLVHPNAAGAARMAQTVWPYLQPLIAQVSAKVEAGLQARLNSSSQAGAGTPRSPAHRPTPPAP